MKRITEWLLKIYMAVRFADEATQKQRYETCQKCEHKELEFCRICKCFLPAKTKVRSQRCPDQRW